MLQVIMATNRADTLDPALLRPGRLDRKIEFPVPDRRQKRLVFQACTGKMNLSEVGIVTILLLIVIICLFLFVTLGFCPPDAIYWLRHLRR